MQRTVEEFKKTVSQIAGIANATFIGDGATVVTGLTMSSNQVQVGDLFIALPGEKVHGAQFIQQAVAQGAVAVLTDEIGSKEISEIPLIISTNPRQAAGVISAWFYNEPMRDLYSVGITGTNGKTTVTTLLYQLMMAAGRETGLIGTVETRIGVESLPSTRTTPESTELQALAAVMREQHMRNLVMEVSSHAIALERIRGSHFAVVGFTNLSQDHLDFHKTMEDYFSTKSRLFTFEFADLAVINIDDKYGIALAQSTELPVVTVSRNDAHATWHYTSISKDYVGAHISIRGTGGVLIEGKVQLHGGYNYDNLLMAVAIACESGIDPIDIAAILPQLTGAPGRLESVRLGQKFTALVDYAHSPDAITRVLETAHEISDGRVIAVLGCGGDRDTTKRPMMGRALLEGSDVAIFTSDNPRSEKPEEILDQMTFGLDFQKPHTVIVDRSEAIAYAVNQAQEGDLVVVLGKGHEKGQEIAGAVLPFDDRLELGRAIEDKK